jgi:hypothetical protein
VLEDMPRSHPGWPRLFLALQALGDRFEVALPWSADNPQTGMGPSEDSPETVAEVSAASASASASAAAAAAAAAVSEDTDSTERQGSVRPACDNRDFERFWRAYPRKVGKRPASKAFAAALVRKAEPATILAGLDASIRRWRAEGTEVRYIPHPATWLNGDRWVDEGPGPPLRPTDWRLDPARDHVPG